MYKILTCLFLLACCAINAQVKHTASSDSLQGFKEPVNTGDLPDWEMQSKRTALQRLFIKQKYHLGNYKLSNVDSMNTTACTNIGFESGNMNGWTVTSGINTNSGTMAGCCSTATGIAMAVYNSYDTSCIMNSSPFAGSNIVKINDAIANKSVTRIRYSYPVSSGNTLLEMAYMFMSQRSNHNCDSLPYMSVRVLDASNNVIANAYLTGPRSPGTCSTSPSYTGCVFYPNVVYSSGWKRETVALTSFVGSTVTIEVTASDCTNGDHYGYGYFDARCNTLDATCNNIDFEAGNLNTWTGTNAINTDSQTGNTSSFTAGNTESAVLTGGSDPNKGFSLVSPLGGSKVVRLNDFSLSSTNASYNKLSRTFSVTASNNVFQYAYMTILQDGSHICSQQSYMQVNMFDQDGNTIHNNKVISNGSACTLTATGFSLTVPYYYTNWQTQTVNLSAYTGSLVTVEFAAADCIQFGHIGYSYFDAKCGSSTSIKELNDELVKIWPNPAKDALNIQLNENTAHSTVLIYDALGQLVMKRSDLQQQNHLDLNGWSTGIYLYKLVLNNETVRSGKFIKE